MNENCMNMRCRIQRLNDLKLFSGWVEAFNFPNLKLRLEKSKTPINIGEQFRVEIFCLERKVCFDSNVESFFHQFATLNITSQIQYMTTSEDARFYLASVYGNMEFDGKMHPLVVVDASVQGMGIIVDLPITKSATVNIGIEYRSNTFKCGGEVRYCRELRDNPGKYRCGIMIQSMSRIDRARYLELIHESRPEAA